MAKKKPKKKKSTVFLLAGETLVKEPPPQVVLDPGQRLRRDVLKEADAKLALPAMTPTNFKRKSIQGHFHAMPGMLYRTNRRLYSRDNVLNTGSSGFRVDKFIPNKTLCLYVKSEMREEKFGFNKKAVVLRHFFFIEDGLYGVPDFSWIAPVSAEELAASKQPST